MCKLQSQRPPDQAFKDQKVFYIQCIQIYMSPYHILTYIEQLLFAYNIGQVQHTLMAIKGMCFTDIKSALNWPCP